MMIKLFSLIVFVCLLIAPLGCSVTQLFVNDDVTMLETKSIMQYLASDEMRGRNTPSPELEQSAEYIVSKFKEYGLESVNGSYYHTYRLQRPYLGEPNSFTITVQGKQITLPIKEEFVPFEQSASAELVNKELVFVGYGITAPEFGWNDYAGLDVRGKIVVAVQGEPASNDDTFFRGGNPTRYSFSQTKIRNAIKQGADGILYISNPTKNIRIKPQGSPIPPLFDIPKSAQPLMYSKPEARKILAIHIGERSANALFGTTDSLSTILNQIDSSKSFKGYTLKGITADVTITMKPEIVEVKNVMAMIRGTDSTAGYIVVGGHYDHVGVHTDSRHKSGKSDSEKLDSIYNGADDNASGTTGVLLSARAISRYGKRPKYSIVFVCFSGEEKGLLGSNAWVNECPLDIKQCKAMLNMDMIGRNSPDSLSIGGQSRSLELSRINEELNKTLSKPFILSNNIEDFFFRSDQANFAMKRIPVLFYFSGMHKDYHQPGDELSKIVYDKLVRSAELCTKTAWSIANRKEPLTYTPQGGEE
jgi:Zn-dependent M28 family amino/carboxypeptidase